MKFAGHVARVGERKGVHRVLVGKLEGKRPLGRPRCRWEIILRWIFRKWDVSAWTGSIWAQDRDRLRALVNAVMNLRGSIKCGEFLD